MSGIIDRRWFEARLASRNLTMAEVARRMRLDRSALSKILGGQRNLRATELVEMATILGSSPTEVAHHLKSRADAPSGKGEWATAADANHAGGRTHESKDADDFVAPRHPAFGFMKGLLTPVGDQDPTEPAFPDWEQYADKKYGTGGGSDE